MKKTLAVAGLAVILLVIPALGQGAVGAEPQLTLEEKLKEFNEEQELVDLRSEHRRTFRDAGGKRVTIVATEPLNYLDADQRYYPIDTRLSDVSKTSGAGLKNLAKAAEPQYPFVAEKNSIQSRFGEFSTDGAQMEYQGHQVSFVLDHPQPRQGKIDGNKIRYRKIFDNCDLEYTILPGKVKDELIFYSVPKSPVISFKVSFNDLTPRNGKDGAINLVDANGEPVFTILPSVMYEQGDQDRFKNIETKFHQEGEQLYCDLILDLGWFKRKERKFPVVVDPQMVPFDSVGKEDLRFRLHAPETYSSISWEAKVTGPGYHGHLGSHTDAKFSAKNLTTGQVFDSYSGLGDHYSKSSKALTAGHDYEVYIRGGKAKNMLGKKYTGSAWAVVEYGDDRLSLFQTVPERRFNMTVGSTLEKVFTVSYPQTVSYEYQMEATSPGMSSPPTPYFRIYYEGSSTALHDLQTGTGKIHLSAGTYRVILSPGWNHFRAQLDFPRGTANYERRIELRTDPGQIDSTLMAPARGEVLLQYQTKQNASPSSQAYPTVKLTSDDGAIFERKYDLGYYSFFDGGDKVVLEKERAYHLIVSRGRNGGNGWGQINLDFYHASNKIPAATGLRVVTAAGGPALADYAGNTDRLRFDYADPDHNTLKTYVLRLSQTEPALQKEWAFEGQQLAPGQVTISYALKDLGVSNGATVTGRVEIWDGFDTVQMLQDLVFIVDNLPPEIQTFQGEVDAADNSLRLNFQDRDELSGIAKRELSWKSEGQPGGNVELGATDLNYTLTGLPANSRVELTYRVMDRVGNMAEKVLVFYTYPEKARLAAPTVAANRDRALLKISKAETSYLRVERYRGQVSESTKDYDTGYRDVSTLALGSAGAPHVRLMSPATGAVYNQPADVYLSADAYDVDGRVLKVSFYANGTLIGSVSRSPYNLAWKNATAGVYRLTAVALDDDGQEIESEPATITITNRPATVTVAYPQEGASFAPPASFTVTANAFDSDGTVARVDFYANNVLMGSASKNPYSIQLRDLPAGIYGLTAKAIDNNGAESVSNPVTIRVVPPAIGPYGVNFTGYNSEDSGVRNLFRMYLPATQPAAGTYNYGAIGGGATYWINNSGHIQAVPCRIRVKYVVGVGDDWDDNTTTPYFRVTLNDGTLLVNQEFYNSTRNGEFYIPAGGHVLVDLYSGRRENEHTIHSDDHYGYQCWYSLTFEYILDTPDLSQNSTALSLIPTMAAMTVTSTATDVPQYYTLPEPEPAKSHETYIYRIYSKNGDKEVYTDSQPVPVANGIPEIRAMNPEAESLSYSNGRFGIELAEVYDDDGDELRYEYRLEGLPGSGVTKATSYQWNSLPDGTYQWTAAVRDNYAGESVAHGKVVVDKTVPLVGFKINDYRPYTNNPLVRLDFYDVVDQIAAIRVSNDGSQWTTITERQGTNWELTGSDGPKTVCLQSQNLAGTWGPVVQRSIILDRTLPDLSQFAITSQGREKAVYFRWTAARDVLSGLAEYEVAQLKDNGWQPVDTEALADSVAVAANGYNLPVRIRVRAIDRAGNRSGWVEALGYTKAAAGAVNLKTSWSGYSEAEGHFIQLELVPAEGAVRYKLICTEDPGGGATTTIDGNNSGYRNTGLVRHGVYSYKVYSYNSAGELTENPVEYTLTILNQPPRTPAGLSPAGFVNQGDHLRLTLDRALDGLDPDLDTLTVRYFLSKDGQNYSSSDLALITGLADGGSYWWYAEINDGYGGVARTEPVRFTIDLTPPEIIIDQLGTAFAAEHLIHPSLVETGSGIRQITLNGVKVAELPREIRLAVQGVNPLSIAVEDRAGNTASFNHIYYVDKTPPELNALRFSLSQKDGSFLAGESLIPAEWDGSDPESGIRQFYYAWSESSSGFDPERQKAVAVLGGLDHYQVNLAGEFEDGHTYYLHLRAENYLGLLSGKKVSPPLFYDHSAPGLRLNGLGGGADYSGYYYLSGLGNLIVDYQAEDSHSGVNQVEYALVEAVDQDEIAWVASLSALAGTEGLTPGKIYYLGLRATNGTGLATTVFSQPLILDATAPELTIGIAPEQADDRRYLAQVSVSDAESMLRRMSYAIGTAPGKSDLSVGLAGAASDGWVSVNPINPSLEISQPASIRLGTVYYVTVRAENAAGLVRIKSSDPVTVTGGNAPVIRDQGRYSANPSQLQFEWHLPGAPAVSGYQYQVREKANVIRGWTETQATAVTVEELSLVHGGCYYLDVRAVFGDGSNSPVGSSDGIIVDLTPPEIKAFNVPAYSDGSGIALTWEAVDPESDVHCYAGLSTEPGGADLSGGWIYLGNLGYFKLTQTSDGQQLNIEHGKSYYLTLWAENGAGLVVQETGAAVRIDRTPPPAPVVIDGGNYTNRNDLLKFTWKWPLDDAESGLREYWYALTTDPAVSGNETWYNNGTEREALLDELELEQGERYYLAVKAVNQAGLSAIGFSDGIIVDTTAPNLPQAVDYGDYSISASALDVAVVASDAESGIAGYRLSLGTAAEPEAIVKDRQVLSSGGLEGLHLDGLALKEGEVYYFTVTAVNQAGLESYLSGSDGIMVDTRTAEITEVIVASPYQTDTERLAFTWQATETPSGIAGVQYAISNDPAGSNLSWQTAGLGHSQTITGLTLEDGLTYYLFLRIQSRAAAENNPELWSKPGRSGPVTVDRTPPEIRLNLPGNGLVGKSFPLRWEARETSSGITEYRYAVGTSSGSANLTGGWVTLTTAKSIIALTREDLSLVNGQAYYLSVMARNGAGLWSALTQSQGLVAELTPPEVTRLEYGSNYLRSLGSISGINWSGADEESGISAYRAALVTVADGRDLTGGEVAVDRGEGSIVLDQLSLRDGGVYYIALQVKNGVDTWSKVAYSQPIRVDVTAPLIHWADELPESVTLNGELDIPWSASETGSVGVELLHPLGQLDRETRAMNLENSYAFRQSEKGRYILTLSPADEAGNKGQPLARVIRVNAPPVANPGPDRTVFKGAVVHFIPEVADEDGTVIAYQWDFGNGKTSAEAEPSLIFGQKGVYTVTLTVQDNDGQWSEPAITIVTVNNSTSGSLQTDETWDGEVEITGDIIVPNNIVLTIQAGARIYFTGNYGIKVNGKIVIAGTAEQPVTINSAGDWTGIRLDHSEGVSAIRYVTFKNATVGVAVFAGELNLDHCVFSRNRIGIHVIAAAPRIEECEVSENTIYGIKEDDQARPTVIGCVIKGNGVADYYEDGLGIINIEQLNQLGGNQGNK